MRDLHELGIHRSSGVSSGMIENVERRLGVRLPTNYREFVSFNDEAQPTVGVFSFGDDETCVSEFLKFSDRQDELNGILRYASAANVPSGIVPIARDAGDYLICIDARSGGDEIILIDPNSHRTWRVAETFAAFLTDLHD